MPTRRRRRYAAIDRANNQHRRLPPTKPTTCPYCHSQVNLSSHRNTNWTVYTCSNPSCDAQVGCHPGTNRALGFLANRELRILRSQAHAAFDASYARKGVRNRNYVQVRKDAYKQLSRLLGIPVDHCHLSWLTSTELKQIITIYGLPPNPNPRNRLNQPPPNFSYYTA